MKHMFPHAKVLRETEWKRKEEGVQDRHSLTLWPFQMLSDHKSICITAQPQLNCQESFLWRQGGTGAMTPSHTKGVLRGCSAKDPSCHPPTFMCYILTSSVKCFFFYPEQIPQIKVLFLMGGRGWDWGGAAGTGQSALIYSLWKEDFTASLDCVLGRLDTMSHSAGIIIDFIIVPSLQGNRK